jgi:hypothetical protein
LVDSRVADLFRPYLQPGERIQWTGLPARGVIFTPQDIFVIPFSILWLGFVVFWEVTVVTQGGDPSGLVFGGVMFVFGFTIMVGRFFIDAWVRTRTAYAITGQRALVLRSVFGEKLLSAPLGGELRVRQGRGGRGTLEFGSGSRFARFFGAMQRQSWSIWVPSISDDVRFLSVPDVMEAYRHASTPAP